MSMARLCLGSVCMTMAGLLPSAAENCHLPRGERVGIVATTPDPVLADGRIVRLAGVLPKGGGAELPRGEAVFHPLSRQADRWGRLNGFLVPDGGDLTSSLNLVLLRQGRRLALPGDWPPGCFALALAAEGEARRAKRGLWAGRDLVLQATDLDGLRAAEGRFVIVEGVVRSVRRGRSQVFLNFGPFGSDRLSVTVPTSRLDAFSAEGRDVLNLAGAQVSLRGVVGPGPSMELNVADALLRLRSP